jgi:hypothetical protein
MIIRGHDSVDANTRVFLYTEYWTDSNNTRTRQILLKNIEFYQWGGNTNSTYYQGVMIAGYNSSYYDDASATDWRGQFQSRLQGCSIHSSNRSDNYQGFTARHSHFGFAMRNNAAVNVGNHPFWFWSSNHNFKFCNNYSTWSQYCNFYFDSFYEPYTEAAYNYGTRSEDYGVMLHHYIEPTPFRHFIIKNVQSYPCYFFYSQMDVQFDRLYMDGYRYTPYIAERNGEIHFTDCYIGNRWAKSIDGTLEVDQLKTTKYWIEVSNTNDRHQYYRSSGRAAHTFYYDVNFQDGTMAETFGAGMIYTDTKGDRFIYSGVDDGAQLWANVVYVPANTTVRISCKLKSDGGSFSYPYLFAKKQMDGYNRGRFRTKYTNETSTLTPDSTDQSRVVGWYTDVQFSATMKTEWEEERLTIDSQKYPYMLVYGLWGFGNMAEEKIYFTEPVLAFDKAPKSVGRAANGKPIKVRNSFTQDKKRISGRL